MDRTLSWLADAPGGGPVDAAFDAAARAQAAGVAFSLQHDQPGSPTMIVGPRLEVALVDAASGDLEDFGRAADAAPDAPEAPA